MQTDRSICYPAGTAGPMSGAGHSLDQGAMTLPMYYQAGCLVCGEELHYSDNHSARTCFYCGAVKPSNASCRNGHYVCDACHNGTANDLIERFCGNTGAASPVAMALQLMSNPVVKMHGPEHHFLVAAVLLAAILNQRGADKGVVAEKLKEARNRAEEVKGGFCGFQGACGAAIGAGIFMSLVTGATPLSDRERKLSNLITADCLRAIAENCGARCCKRESFLAIMTAVEFVRRELGIDLPIEEPPKCTFTGLNRECPRGRCGFFGGAADQRELRAVP